jgi:hypothetical protein
VIQFSVAKVSATCHTFRGGAWLSGKLSCAFEITKPPCGEETATNTKTVTHGAEKNVPSQKGTNWQAHYDWTHSP